MGKQTKKQNTQETSGQKATKHSLIEICERNMIVKKITKKSDYDSRHPQAARRLIGFWEWNGKEEERKGKNKCFNLIQ